MATETIPRVLPNGAHVIASTLADGHYLVLCWWDRKEEYVSWWVNPGGSPLRDDSGDLNAYGGQYRADWRAACAAYELRRGSRGVALQDLLDGGDSPAQENLDASWPDDLRELSDDETRPRHYRAYAWVKAWAMDCRSTGDIKSALAGERACEILYKAMPEGLRW